MDPHHHRYPHGVHLSALTERNSRRVWSDDASDAGYAFEFINDLRGRLANRGQLTTDAYGYSNDYPVERYYRDAIGLSLYEGTGEIQKLIIGRETLGIAAFA